MDKKLTINKMKYLLSILLSLITFNVYSLELTLSQGTVKPTPIAVTDLFSQASSLEKVGKNISSYSGKSTFIFDW